MRKSLFAILFLATSWMPVNGDYYCAPCGPLNPCEWNASFRAGVEWMYYPDTRRNDYNNYSATTVVVVDDDTGALISSELLLNTQVDTVRTPKFTNQFTVPWTIVGEIGYAFTSNTEVFADFHFGRASGRNRSYSIDFDALTTEVIIDQAPETFTLVPARTWSIDESYTDLKYFGGTIGMRHYFDPICQKFYPFFGVKAGVRHFDPVRATVVAQVTEDGEEPEVAQTVEGIYYDSYNKLHGGFQLGITMKCGDCINFFVMAEALATCGLKAHESGFNFTNDGTTTTIGEETVDVTTAFDSNLNVPARKTFNILSFPVTVGVQYLF